MNLEYVHQNLWFLLGTFLTVVALSGLVLRWTERDAKKREIDRNSSAFGLYAIANWSALLVMLHAAFEPTWQTVDRMNVMALSLKEIGAFYAFFVGFAVGGWLLLTRLSFFLYFWVFQERLVRGAVAQGKNGPVLIWAGMVLFMAYFVQAALAKLYLAYVPFPDLPSFN